jgi:alkaline phosphatase D
MTEGGTPFRDAKEARMTLRIPRQTFRGLSRRRFLSTAAATGISAIAMPYLSRAADRPMVTHGVQSGDVGADSGVVWARADRPAQMLVEVSTTESFGNARALPPIAALPESDFTAKMLLENLPGGQDIFYRVRFRDLSHSSVESEPVVGRFALRRPTGATSVSSGAATLPVKAGASTPTTAACSPSRR